jgi:hypothetical protein
VLRAFIPGALQNRAPPTLTGDFNATIEHDFHGIFKEIDVLIAAFLNGQDPVLQAERELFTADVGDPLAKVDAVMNGFDHVVIMPGGEAFKFTGLDTDEEGAVYSHLTYQAGTDGPARKGVPNGLVPAKP